MIKEGALENPKPDAIFGLHVISGIPAGMITYRAGPLMASADWLYITVKGKQTHGAWPWVGHRSGRHLGADRHGLAEHRRAPDRRLQGTRGRHGRPPSTAARARTSFPTRSR